MKYIAVFTVAVLMAVSVSAEILVKSGETIVFLGDSITQFGNRPDGYVRLVMDGLKRSGIDAKMIPAGISGHKSNDMLGRVDRDVIRHKPDWMLLSCGVNDVGHGIRGVKLEDFKKNITAILDKAQAAGIKVMILTPTLCREKLDDAANKKLEGYCEFLRDTAKNRKLPVADLNRRMREELAARKNRQGHKVTIDGLHMNGYGNQMMAAGVLEAFGVPAEKIASMRKEWNRIPSMAPILNHQHNPRFLISIDDYELLRAEAGRKNCSVDQLVRQILAEHIEKLKK